MPAVVFSSNVVHACPSPGKEGIRQFRVGRTELSDLGQAVGQVLSFGVGVALSPLPIIAVVLMLATPRGRVNGPAFLAGWVVGLAAVGTVVLLAASGGDAGEAGEPADWVSVLKLVLGVLLLGLAVKQWRGRPHGEQRPELPAWMNTVDTFTPMQSAGIAVGLSAINPKNLILTVVAAAAIAQTGAGTGGQAVALAVFVLLGTLGVGLPVAISVFMVIARRGFSVSCTTGWPARTRRSWRSCAS
jgi:threonine/homoserine/homoserine lactone efflux protein